MAKVTPTTRFRIVIGSADFHTNTRQIRQGIGGAAQCNRAVIMALDHFEQLCAQRRSPAGLSGYYNGLNVQLDLID